MTTWLLVGILFGFVAIVVLSLCKAAKQADEAIGRHRDSFGVATYDPEPPAEDLEIPAFLRPSEEEFPRERRNRE